MKKIGVMLIALLALGFVLTGCGLLNPLKNTTWEFVESYEETYAGVTVKVENKYSMSFTDKDANLVLSGSASYGGVVQDTESMTYSGPYEYADGKVTGTLNYAGEALKYSGSIDKDTLSITFEEGTEALKLTKVKK